MEILLTYFDQRLGPVVFKAIPEPISEKERELVEQIMDFQNDCGFFEFENDVINSANFIFEIVNKLARGKSERLMLSILENKKLKDFSKYRRILTKYSEIIINTKGLPIVFYRKSDDQMQEMEKVEIDNADVKLEKILKGLLLEVQKQFDRLKIGNVFILGLDHVGKTALIRELNDHELNPLEMNVFGKVIRVVFENTDLDILDVGGNKNFQVLWAANPDPPEAIVYILDYSKGTKHFNEAKVEFEEIMKFFFGDKPVEALPMDTPVLIIANKVKDIDKLEINFLENLLNPKQYKINYRTGYVSFGMEHGLHNNFKWIIEEFLNTIQK